MDGFPYITTFGKISIDNSSGTEIGTCRARSIERVSGSGGTTASRYRLHIFDFTGTMTAATQLDAQSSFDFAANIAQTSSVNVFNLGPDSLIYKLPYDRIKTLNTVVGAGTPDYNYRFETNRIIAANGVVTSGSVSFTTAVANEVFGTKANNTNWVLVNDNGTGLTDNPAVNVNNITVNGAGTTATITGLTAFNGDTLRLIAPFIRTATHKTKTLSGNTAVNFSAGVTGGYDGAASSHPRGQYLGHADVHELVSVVETSGGANVTTHFELDTGQRDDYYDRGSVKLKSTSNYTAAAALTVTYKYFSHSAGDFFTVDSYTGQIDYTAIPKIGDIELRSAVDFRPRVADAGGAFTGTGAITAHAPTRFTQFETDIQFYLGRIDKVFLDSKGNFGIAGGVPSRYPEPPEIPSDSMHLYTMTIPAYTLTADEVTLDFIDNRRYTMRDIGRIDKRISQIEYYSVL